jgi:hypothetical protein
MHSPDNFWYNGIELKELQASFRALKRLLGKKVGEVANQTMWMIKDGVDEGYVIDKASYDELLELCKEGFGVWNSKEKLSVVAKKVDNVLGSKNCELIELTLATPELIEKYKNVALNLQIDKIFEKD